jgi:hypothetical protein
MKRNASKTAKRENPTGRPACLCQGLGPLLTDFLRRLGPPEEASRHFETARVEVLKGLRAILDGRIEQITGAKAKGEKIRVE